MPKDFNHSNITKDYTKTNLNVLKQSNDYRYALDETTMVATTNRRSIITFVNEKFCQISQFTQEDLIGKKYSEINIIKNDDTPPTISIWRCILAGKVWKGEQKNKKKDGSIYWVAVTIVPFLDENKKPYQFLGIFIDITEQKKSEAKLTAINEELESLTYSISHDLKAPLRAINGYAKILEEDYIDKIDDDGKAAIKAISKNCERMNSQIADLLAYSRLGNRELNLSELNTRAIVTKIINKVIESNSEVHANQFFVGKLIPLTGDSDLITHLWNNLISNAIKFSKNVNNRKIEIDSYFTDDSVVYFIKDNGEGFDMKYYSKLFNIFQRLHTSLDYDGSGIGLAIAKKIVKKHQGQIWAKSELNSETIFYFSFPKHTTNLDNNPI